MMTSDESTALKEVIYINQSAHNDYEAMPPDIKEAADQAITQIQNEKPLPAKMFKPLKENLSGIDEVVLPYDSDTYRVYVALYKSAIYILDAGIKKSKTGHEIPPNQKERLIRRREQASKDYETNKAEIERFAAARKAKRDYLIKIGAEI
jgi:phage-related protein